MNVGLLLTIVALMFVILITFIYFKKGTIDLFENKVYGFLLESTIVGFVINIISFIIDMNYPSVLLLRCIFLKLYYAYLVCFISSMTLYVYSSIKREISKKVVGIFMICSFLVTFVDMFLPLNLSSTDINYIDGFALYFVYIFMFASIGAWIILIFKNWHTDSQQKFLPFVFYIILLIPVFYIQFNYSELLLETVLISFILVLMYHTIENPDVRMLNEVYKSKEISDSANDEKSLFIYNITQESRRVTKNINNIVETLLDSDNINDIKDMARNIINETSNYASITYDILGVNSSTTGNFRLYKEEYNFKNMIKEIVALNSKICQEKNVMLRVNVDNNIPEKLYGDSIQLKNCINTLISYSLNSIVGNNNYIEINVSTVIKDDVCRLFVVVEDNGKGMSSDELNKILNNNKNISDVNTTIVKMAGALSITSNIGVGTRFKIILDQVIGESQSEIKKFESFFENKNILIVDDSTASIKIFDKLLKDSKIDITACNNGKECIEKIKNKEKFNLILIDEDLNNITGYELLSKIKTIRNFNTPCILLTKDTSNEYVDNYAKGGFDDYLLKPIVKESLLEKLDTYLNKNN